MLNEVVVDPRARFLWSFGLDGGDFAGTTCDWFVKDLPLQRLTAGDVLVAYEVNGVPLPAEHGFPVRLVVPGYYGTNSVKWLWRLHLAEHRAEGPFTTKFYNDEADAADRAAGRAARRPLWSIAPESLIVAPAPDTVLPVGERTEIWGWAWSFRGIADVEVSLDGGERYMRATVDQRHDWAWQRFSLPWTPLEQGETLLHVRAREMTGAGQPRDGARNAVHTVRIFVQ